MMNNAEPATITRTMAVTPVAGGEHHVPTWHPADPDGLRPFPKCRTGGYDSRATRYVAFTGVITCRVCLEYIRRAELAGVSFYPADPTKIIPGAVEPAVPAIAQPADLTEAHPMTTTPNAATRNAARTAVLAELAAGPVKGGPHVQVARGLAMAAAQIRREMATHTDESILLALRIQATSLERQAIESAALEGPHAPDAAPGWPSLDQGGNGKSVLEFVAAGMAARRGTPTP